VRFDQSTTVRHKVKAQQKAEQAHVPQEPIERRKSSRVKVQIKPILEKPERTNEGEPKKKRPKQTKSVSFGSLANPEFQGIIAAQEG